MQLRYIYIYIYIYKTNEIYTPVPQLLRLTPVLLEPGPLWSLGPQGPTFQQQQERLCGPASAPQVRAAGQFIVPSLRVCACPALRLQGGHIPPETLL